jgi:uncharacterized membrane protein YtjA (UPF0391 family)
MSALAFALACGLFYTVLGVLELFPPVSPIVAAVHLMLGLWGLAARAGATSPVRYARVATVIFTLLAVVGLVPALHPFLGLLPIEGRDVWMHLVTALIAAYFGFRQAAGDRRFRAGDRRRKPRAPIPGERRQGFYDRRHAMQRAALPS